MCGIVGWLGADIDRERATHMTAALTRRGPDSGGEWFGDGVFLGHRRLAVLDLSPLGHQPMVSACGRYVLTYNGEIYNYKSLRHELASAGMRFHGDSDTEVLLQACVHWGVERTLPRLEGMFAFGLYDTAERVLWLARDPMGIKPLYYAQAGERFAFSSELTPLLALPWVDRRIDQDALHAYFRGLCVPAPASIVSGARKLPSGSLLSFKSGEVAQQRYWRLDEHVLATRASVRAMSPQDAADQLDGLLRHSVRQHMQADVPYGAFLSGGVDSSTVVALMQAESSRAVKTFAIGFEEGSHDESVHARAVARHLGTDHHELILSAGEVMGLVPQVSAFYDEPFADNSAIPTYLVSKFARQSVTVCLSGDGGDELFGGYPRYFWGNRIEALRSRLSPIGAKAVAGLLQGIPAGVWNRCVDPMLGYRYSSSEGLAYRVRRFANYLGCSRHEAFAQSMMVWCDTSELLCGTSKQALGAEALAFPALSWSEEMMLVDQLHYLQDDILTKVDRASMAVSLEARVPLLTHPLVEWSWRLAPSLKLAPKGDRGKLILRDVLYRYVPKALIERPKMGFGMPVGQWLRGPLREWAESLLRAADLEACGLSAQAVHKAWAEHQAGMDRQARIWTVLMYRAWHQRVMGN